MSTSLLPDTRTRLTRDVLDDVFDAYTSATSTSVIDALDRATTGGPHQEDEFSRGYAVLNHMVERIWPQFKDLVEYDVSNETNQADGMLLIAAGIIFLC